MPSVTTSGIGLESYWPEGSNGWKPGMDENLIRMSSLAQLSVPSIVSALSTGGGVQIAPAGHSNAGSVCQYINGAWWFFAPLDGMRAFVRDVDAWHVYRGGVWQREASAAYVISPIVTASRLITETEFAVGATIQVNAVTDVILTVPGPSAGATPFGASLNRRPVTIIRTGTGEVTVAAASGSTLLAAEDAFSARAQGSAFAIIPLSGNQYSIQGDLA